MVWRLWRGLAKATRAAAYLEHLQLETFPAIRKLPGFIGASILQRSLPDGVEFLVVTQWQSLEAIQAFAGANIEVAVVPQRVRDMMIEYDAIARHYDVVA